MPLQALVVSRDGRWGAGFVMRLHESSPLTPPAEYQGILIDLTEGKIVRQFMAEPSSFNYHLHRLLAFSPDGRRMAFPSKDFGVSVIEVEDPSAEPLTVTGPQWHLNCLAFSEDGHQLAAAGWKGKIWVWDLDDGELACPPLEGHQAGILRLQYVDGDRALLSYGDDYASRMWSLEAGQEMLRIDGYASLHGSREEPEAWFFLADMKKNAASTILPVPPLDALDEKGEKR